VSGSELILLFLMCSRVLPSASDCTAGRASCSHSSSRQPTALLLYNFALHTAADAVVQQLRRCLLTTVPALQAVMGFIMIAEDPLFRIYVLGAKPVGPLKRPFKKDASPFAA
jgi:Phosphate transport (Pho88)